MVGMRVLNWQVSVCGASCSKSSVGHALCTTTCVCVCLCAKRCQAATGEAESLCNGSVFRTQLMPLNAF